MYLLTSVKFIFLKIIDYIVNWMEFRSKKRKKPIGFFGNINKIDHDVKNYTIIDPYDYFE
jgi:hypothetical protein